MILLVFMDLHVKNRITRMSSRALSIMSPIKLGNVAQRAFLIGIVCVILLALTSLIPNTYSLIVHNTIAAAHFVTAGIWQLHIVYILDHTSPHQDPHSEAVNRHGIRLKKQLAWLGLASTGMVIGLFGVFKSLGAEDDHVQSDVMDNSPALQVLRWILWPGFEYITVICENVFTWTLYQDLQGLGLSISLAPLIPSSAAYAKIIPPVTNDGAVVNGRSSPLSSPRESFETKYN